MHTHENIESIITCKKRKMASCFIEKEQEESLREAAALGNNEKLELLIHHGVQVNAQNAVNGWTPLHWACKRGHLNIVEQLLNHGADVNLQTTKGETCLQMTENPAMINLLGGNSCNPADAKVDKNSISTLPIVPNYLSNPVFPYYGNNEELPKQCQPVAPQASPATSQLSTTTCRETVDLIVLKVRVANSEDPDFIEVDLPSNSTFEQLVALLRTELGIVESGVVRKVRKLPDTIVRNDRDVRRLRHFQELELVMISSGCAGTSSTVNLSTAYTAAVTPKRIDVVY